MYIYLSNYRTSYRLLFIPWYKFGNPLLAFGLKSEDWRFHRNSFLKSSILPICGGGLTIRRKNPVESSIWREKASIRLPIPFHSIPPSIHPIHPPILSIRSILSVHLHIYLPSYLFTYLSTYLPIYLPIYLAIYLSIHPSNYTLQSLGCMWIEDSRKNNLQSKEGHRGYRQQEALRSLQTDYKAKLHRFWHLLMQIAWPVSFSNFPSAADGHILLNAPESLLTSEVKQERARAVLT